MEASLLAILRSRPLTAFLRELAPLIARFAESKHRHRMPSAPASNALRKGRASQAGRICLVTAFTWGRAHLFAQCGAARTVARLSHASSTWPDATCLAWVVMPDHWHGLIQLDQGDLSRTVARFKSKVTVALRASGRKYPVWQQGFDERTLRAEDNLRTAARYLVGHPVRAGLVDRIGDYPYWDAVWVGGGA